MDGRDAMAKTGLAAASVLVAVALASMVFYSASPGSGGALGMNYYGARILPPGPASVGLPAIPVRVAQDGTISGLPTHLNWYGYCRPEAPGLDPRFPTDDAFRYYMSTERLAIAHAQGVELWYEGRLGKVANAADFAGDWSGAPVMWRSEGRQGTDVLPAVLVKVGPGTKYPNDFWREFAPDGFVAFLSSSTGFCCTAGYGENDSARARIGDRFLVFESCHDSRWDPAEVRTYPVGFRYDDALR